MKLTPAVISAISSGKIDILKKFRTSLEKSKSIYPSDYFGNSALAIAALNNKKAVASWLYDEKLCDLLQTNDQGWTAITLAANRDAVDIVTFILDKKPELLSAPNKEGFTPFLAAAMGGASKVIALLLTKKDAAHFKNELTPGGKNGLALAAINDYVNIITQLCEAGFPLDGQNPNTKRTALMEAALNTKKESFLYLAKRDVDLTSTDYQGWTAITLAANRNAVDIVTFILEKKPELLNTPNEAGFTPFLAAAMGCASHVMAFLLTKKDIKHFKDELTPDGKNGLALAAINGHVNIITQLCEAGFPLDGQNPNTGRTALMEAILNSKDEAIHKLLELNSNVNLKDIHGFTLFHLSAYANNANILTRLLKVIPQDNITSLLLERSKDNKEAHELASTEEVSSLILSYSNNRKHLIN